MRAAHLPPLERHHGWKEIFSPDARAELTGRRNGFDPVDLLRARFAETEGAELLARLQDVDLGTYLVDDLLVKTDRASMAHSLEARVPFLDPVVTNFALALADRHKVRGLRKKVLLRKAAAPLVPPELLRRRKRGFSIPAAAWLRGDLEPFARETLSAETLRRQGFFRPEAVTRLIDDHVAGREDLSRQLWGLLAFTLWHERHVEQTPGALARAEARSARQVKVWIDISAPAHVLVFRPLIALLRERGDEVEVTTRDYAQTLELLERHDIDAEVIGAHGGRSRVAKAYALASRLRALRRYAKGRGYDIALAHGSHELTITARRLGIPSATTHDYEYATLQHHLGDRAATRVVVPEAIPEERMARFGVRPPKLLQYPGLKEEYYLYDFEPDPTVLDELLVNRARTLVVVRTPPDVSLYHRRSNPFFPQLLAYLGRESDVHAVVLPRSPEQRDYVRSLSLPSLIVPDHAVDAQSLIALADLVVSAGGTMNREAAALGVPGVHDVRRAARRRRRDADPRRAAAAAHRPARARAREARAGRVGARPARPADPARPAADCGQPTLTAAAELGGARRPALVAVALELRRADARDGGELLAAARTRAGRSRPASSCGRSRTRAAPRPVAVSRRQRLSVS